MNLPNYPPIVWILVVLIGGYLAWWLTRGPGASIAAGGLNNGKSA